MNEQPCKLILHRVDKTPDDSGRLTFHLAGRLSAPEPVTETRIFCAIYKVLDGRKVGKPFMVETQVQPDQTFLFSFGTVPEGVELTAEIRHQDKRFSPLHIAPAILRDGFDLESDILTLGGNRVEAEDELQPAPDLTDRHGPAPDEPGGFGDTTETKLSLDSSDLARQPIARGDQPPPPNPFEIKPDQVDQAQIQASLKAALETASMIGPPPARAEPSMDDIFSSVTRPQTRAQAEDADWAMDMTPQLPPEPSLPTNPEHDTRVEDEILVQARAELRAEEEAQARPAQAPRLPPQARPSAPRLPPQARAEPANRRSPTVSMRQQHPPGQPADEMPSLMPEPPTQTREVPRQPPLPAEEPIPESRGFYPGVQEASEAAERLMISSPDAFATDDPRPAPPARVRQPANQPVLSQRITDRLDGFRDWLGSLIELEEGDDMPRNGSLNVVLIVIAVALCLDVGMRVWDRMAPPQMAHNLAINGDVDPDKIQANELHLHAPEGPQGLACKYFDRDSQQLSATPSDADLEPTKNKMMYIIQCEEYPDKLWMTTLDQIPETGFAENNLDELPKNLYSGS